MQQLRVRPFPTPTLELLAQICIGRPFPTPNLVSLLHSEQFVCFSMQSFVDPIYNVPFNKLDLLLTLILHLQFLRLQTDRVAAPSIHLGQPTYQSVPQALTTKALWAKIARGRRGCTGTLPRALASKLAGEETRKLLTRLLVDHL